MTELEKLLEEYIDFLNEANQGAISIAHAHGWRCSEEHIRKGYDFRNKIADLKAKKPLLKS